MISNPPELQNTLGEVIGLIQALRLILRLLATRLDPELELGQLLQQINAEVEHMQRRCDSFVASHAEIKQSRITGRARQIKVNAARRMPSSVTVTELLRLLIHSTDDIVAGWRAVGTMPSTKHDPLTAGLARSAILLHAGHAEQLTRHLPSAC